MILQPLYEGSKDECWYCPCCKSKLQTVEMLEAKFERRRIALGMTEAEYEAHMKERVAATVRTEPLGEEELRGLHRMLDQFESEWKPPCEHVKNPWKPTPPLTDADYERAKGDMPEKLDA